MGSGKSTLCALWSSWGLPLYNADDAAKSLMETPGPLATAIETCFGPGMYTAEGRLNRELLAKKVFSTQGATEQMNHLVHPAVHADFTDWKTTQEKRGYSIVGRETALLFESNTADACSVVVLVSAPEAVRTERIQHRNGWTLEQIKSRTSKQWSEQQKREALRVGDIEFKNQGTVEDMTQWARRFFETEILPHLSQ